MSDEAVASERMLYEMARRYDEWKGENYEGTSLRGAMKGWHKHGACSHRMWPYGVKRPGHLTAERAADAQRRPLGAYFRVVDSDVSHLQAAVVEGDAVLASGWIHVGWQGDRLQPAPRGAALRVKRIAIEARPSGLHAFAIVGYGPEGFLIQNSWGQEWGTRGLAILSYEDWMENRQDAWVARPGPQTLDAKNAPKIFLDGFMGREASPTWSRTGTSGVEGLEIDSAALPYLINTGDRGALSMGGRLETPAGDLPQMAECVRLARSRAGVRDIMLYAHGGLVGETTGARGAARLWKLAQDAGLLGYFFVWETGISESLLGYLRSQDDAAGPRAGVDIGDLLGKLKKGAQGALRAAQRALGAAVAPAARAEWDEMKGRAQGAARLPARGGAALFAQALFKVMTSGGNGDRFRLHLVGHSAGAIYLGWLYDSCLRALLAGDASRVALGSIHLMAPAMNIDVARAVFVDNGALPVPSARFTVWTLSTTNEDADQIGIYPSSLLTYVADHLDDPAGRQPILGIRSDLQAAQASLGNPTLVAATRSQRHGDFDDAGKEVEEIFGRIVAGT